MEQSFAESIDWTYDGATSYCEGIKGKIIHDENSQPKECQYGELLFQILNIQETCGEARTTWTDPYTEKQFEFTTTCGHPVICKNNGDIEFGHSGRTTNYSHYVKSTFLDVMGLDKKGFVTVEPSGKICYFDAPIYYDGEKNILTIDVDGMWEQATLTVEIPPELHTDDIQVLVNEIPIRFSIEEQFIEPSIVRDRSVVIFDLEQSSEKQLIKILPKIKESFAENNLVEISSKILISNPPKLGETVDFVLEYQISTNSSLPLEIIEVFDIPENFQVINENEFYIAFSNTLSLDHTTRAKNTLIDESGTYQSKITVQAIKNGYSSIVAGLINFETGEPYFGETLYFKIGNAKSLIQDTPFPNSFNSEKSLKQPSPPSSYEETIPLVVGTDKMVYSTGDIVTISGNAQHYQHRDFRVSIVGPFGIVEGGSIEIDEQTGAFSHVWQIPEESTLGSYLISIGATRAHHTLYFYISDSQYENKKIDPKLVEVINLLDDLNKTNEIIKTRVILDKNKTIDYELLYNFINNSGGEVKTQRATTNFPVNLNIELINSLSEMDEVIEIRKDTGFSARGFISVEDKDLIQKNYDHDNSDTYGCSSPWRSGESFILNYSISDSQVNSICGNPQSSVTVNFDTIDNGIFQLEIPRNILNSIDKDCSDLPFDIVGYNDDSKSFELEYSEESFDDARILTFSLMHSLSIITLFPQTDTSMIDKLVLDCNYIPTQQYISPLQQIKIGNHPKYIICNFWHEKVFQIPDSSPICVKSQTAEKLIERGLVTRNYEYH